MQFIYKKCPHCGAVYDSYTLAEKSYKDFSGSPFKVCYKCGSSFVDKDIKEPALQPYDDRKINIFHCFVYYLYPFGLFALMTIGALFLYGTNRTSIWIFVLISNSLYLYFVLGTYFDRKNIDRVAKRDYDESVERLKDEEYARALERAGFNVPHKYLNNTPSQKVYNNIAMQNCTDDMRSRSGRQ